MSDSCYGHFDHMDLFFYWTDLVIFMGGRVNTCYFLDFEKILQKKGGTMSILGFYDVCAKFGDCIFKKPIYSI